MGTKTVQTFPAKLALEATRPDEAVKTNLTIADGFAVQQGDVVGVITSGGLGRRRSRTVAAGTGFADNSNTGQVSDASVFTVDDVLKLEDGTTIGTIASIDLTTTPDTIALDGNAAVNVAVDDAVLASDGSQVAKGISDDANDGTDDTPAGVFISGYLVESRVRGLDASAKAELGGASMVNGIFKF